MDAIAKWLADFHIAVEGRTEPAIHVANHAQAVWSMTAIIF